MAEHTPADDPRTFEDLLADPLEQFDVDSECLPAILASIAEYTAAPSATASAIPPRQRSVRLVPAPEARRGDEHMSEQPPAWWDIQPDNPKITQCEECAALVLRTGLLRHEEWHATISERS